MTAYRLFLLEEAEADLDDAYIWYEFQKQGLGIEFIEEIEKAFEYIINHTKSSAKQYKGAHRYVVAKFPCST